jgi:hypothetical protein
MESFKVFPIRLILSKLCIKAIANGWIFKMMFNIKLFNNSIRKWKISHKLVNFQLKFSYTIVVRELTKNTLKIFHTLATFLELMCNYSFSSMKFDIKKWSYFSHEVAI